MSRPPLETLTLEYRVLDALDGTTEAPPFSTIPGDPLFVQPNDEGIYVFEVDRLGLVDLTGVGTGGLANRFVPWMLVVGPQVPSLPGVVFVDLDDQEIEAVAEIAAGQGIYLRRCVEVPQSGMLGLNNMEAVLGDPILVRLHVWVPRDMRDYVAMKDACCCRQGLPDSSIGTPPEPPLLPIVEIQMRPNTFQSDQDEFASRRVTPGGTADGSFVALPGRDGNPNRYFWFGTNDPTFGIVRGFDPALQDASLAAFVGAQVVAPFGDSTGAQMAALLAAVLMTIPEYSDIQVIGDTVRLRGPDGSSGFVGTLFADRGPANIWGSLVSDPFLDAFSGEGPINNEVIAQYGVGPSVAGIRVEFLDVFIASVHSPLDQLRGALYMGGIPTNPAGAVLLGDFELTTGTGTNQWTRMLPRTEVIIPVANAALWVAIKSDVALTTIGGTAPQAPLQDFAVQQLWSSATMDPDQNVPYEDVFLAGGAMNVNFTISMRIGYEGLPIRGGADLRIRWGSQVAALDTPLTTFFNYRLFTGSPSPDIAEMFLQSVGLAIGTHDASQQPRVAFAQGGVVGAGISDPDTATATDMGQMTGVVADAFVEVPAPSDNVAVARNTVVWIVAKGNFGAALTSLRFDLGPAPDQLDPITNPMNFLAANPEFEQPPGSPGVNLDPAVPYPAVINTTVPPDFLPDNYPNVFARFFTRPFGVVELP